MDEPNKRAQATAARRQLIVDIAMVCFIEKGFHQTSMRDIANRAGISLGKLYNHFESKSELIKEIATIEANELEKLRLQIVHKSDPEEGFAHFIDLYTSYCCQKENAILSAEIIAECLRNPEVGDGFVGNRLKFNAEIAALIDQIIDTSNDNRKVDSKLTAEFVFYLIEGVAMQCTFEQRTPTSREIKSLKIASLQIIQA